MPTQAEAHVLALANAEEEATILRTLWFPNDREFRLIHVDPTTLPSDGVLRTFFFAADPGEGINYPSRVAFALPDEVRQLRLPDGWGSWEEAVVVYERQRAA
jgi:hypothetical protein